MTTSAQQTVLTDEELACLRQIAQGEAAAIPDAAKAALVAKGMLAGDRAAPDALTPAGRHAVDVGGPGMVPGIDE